MTLTLCCLLGENVIAVHLAMLDLSRLGNPEALDRTTIGFHLGHN